MPTTPEPTAGEVWDMLLDPRVGKEQGGYRPALVISIDYYNRAPNGLHIIVPITGTDRGIRYHLPLEPPEGGLSKRSIIMCDQVKAQSMMRFRRKRGAVSVELLERVQAMAGEFIDR